MRAAVIHAPHDPRIDEIAEQPMESDSVTGAEATPPLPLNTRGQGDQPARHFPLPRGIRLGCRFPRFAAHRCASLLTEIVPLADAVRTFNLATDRSRAMKVLLAF